MPFHTGIRPQQPILKFFASFKYFVCFFSHVKLLSFFAEKIKPNGLKVFLRHPPKIPSFVKKTGMPEGSERRMSEETIPESFGKIEAPLYGAECF